MKRPSLLCAVLLLAATLRAADRVGVYCMIEQVVLEPSDQSPQRIQAWGVFAFADAQDADNYGPVQRGYMYYSCPAGKETACKNDWADLRWMAGVGKAIGYGLRSRPIGTLRHDGDRVTPPDPYPFEGGLVKVESKDPAFTGLVARLKEALGK